MTTLYSVEVAADAWNGNAVTAEVLRFDGEYSFRIGQCAGIAVGLAPYPGLGVPTHCTHGFLFEGAEVSITERGATFALAAPFWTSADVFAVRRVGGVVTYLKNGAVLRVSARPSRGEVVLDAALYADGDEVLDVALAPLLQDGQGVGQFPALRAVGQAEDAVGRGALPRLSAPATAVTLDAAASAFPAALGRGASDDAAFGASALPALTASGSSVAPPRRDYGSGVLSPLSAFGTERLPGTAAASGQFPALAAFGADAPEVGRGELPPLRAEARAATFAEALFYGFLPGLTGAGGRAFWSVVAASAPAPALYARGRRAAAGAAWQRVPAPALAARGGGAVSLPAPVPRLALASTLPPFGRVALRLPAPRALAAGLAGALGQAALAVPPPSARSFAGGSAALALAPPALAALAVPLASARVALLVPPPGLSAFASAVALGRLRLSLAVPALAAGLGRRIALAVPPPRLSSASAGAEEPGSVWLMNVSTGAITRWRVGTIVKWAYAHDRLYGLRADGTLLRFDGATDAGAPVAVEVRFAPQQFDTYALKRIDTVYLNANESDGVTLELVADETTAWRYQTDADASPATGTHKIRVGRGVRFHSAAITLRNRDGGRLAVGGIELLVHSMERRPN